MSDDTSDVIPLRIFNSILDDAHVLRRIHKNDVNIALPYPILPRAFRPSGSDTDGLSVYLDDASGGPAPAELAASGRGGRDSYVVVAIRVADLRAIGLTVVAKDIPDGLPGHAIIPELNWNDYQSGKQSRQFQKTLQMKLAELARHGVVYPPDFLGCVNS
jgi:hypothetical protein